MLLAILAIEVETKKQSRSAKNQANKSDLQKRANLPNEIFDYIHVALCTRLFSLAWYNDMIYAATEDIYISAKALPTACCNGPAYQNEEPEFMRREPFIETLSVKYTEFDCEWIAFRTIALKKWRKETSIRL